MWQRLKVLIVNLTIIGFIFLYNKPANFLYSQILMCKDLTIGGNPGFTGHILLLDRMVVQYRIAPSIFSGFNCRLVPEEDEGSEVILHAGYTPHNEVSRF